MAEEVIHEHHDGGGNNMMGVLIAIILIIVVLFLVFWFIGNPFAGGGANTNTAPDSGTTIEVPDEIDVNINDGQ